MIPLFPCVSTYGLSMPAALRRETPRAGCALIKRPHLSAVSFLKSGCIANFLLTEAPLLRCIDSRAAKKRNYEAPEKACQASLPGQSLERSLETARRLLPQGLAAIFAAVSATRRIASARFPFRPIRASAG
jgi:hypothetical protein